MPNVVSLLLVPSLFRRKPAALVDDQLTETETETETEVVEPAGSTRPKGYTPKKGEATPKRPVANKRIVETTPKDPKAARALARQRRTEDSRERREGMMNGDDRFLTARDKGPVR